MIRRSADRGTGSTQLFTWAGLLLVVAVIGLATFGVGRLRFAGHSSEQVLRGGQPTGHSTASGNRLTEIGQLLAGATASPAVLLLAAGVAVHRRARITGLTGQPPAPIDRRAQWAALGTFERAYRRRTAGGRPVTALLIGAVGLLVVGAIWRLAVPVFVGAGLLAVVSLISVVYLLLVVFRARGCSAGTLYQYRGGLVLTRCGRPVVIAWDAVDEIRADERLDRSGAIVHQSYRLAGWNFPSTELRDDRHAGLADLAEQMLPAVAQAQLSAALKRLGAGETLYFGPKISADDDGLTVVGHRAPWDTVNHVRAVDVDHLAIPVPGMDLIHVKQGDVVNRELLRLLAYKFAPAPRGPGRHGAPGRQSVVDGRSSMSSSTSAPTVRCRDV